MWPSTRSLILSVFPLLTAAQYSLEDDYSISNFADYFDFETENDPTNGYVNYVGLAQAQSENLWSTSGNSLRMSADSTKVGTGRGRDAVRIISKKSYNHGLVILDASHMPEGCGTWPAFWMLGPNWPNSGEIDILEGVNSQASNSFAMHTSAGCSITNSGQFSGQIATSNCDVAAAGQGTNVGCAIKTSDTRTYGTGFNQAGGGVYATEWTSEAVTIWFFSRGSIPADITAGTPNPSNWGTPQAQFAGACDIDTHIKDQRIVFTNTFCGDWAGQVWSQDATCAPLASTCQAFVQNNPGAFNKAYWEINSLRVYQGSRGPGSGPVAPSAAPSSPNSVATWHPNTFSTVTVGGSGGTATMGQPQPAPQPTVAPVPAAQPQPSSGNGAVVTQITDGQVQAPGPGKQNPPANTNSQQAGQGGKGNGRGRWNAWNGQGWRGSGGRRDLGPRRRLRRSAHGRWAA